MIGEFHHLGVACRSLDAEQRSWAPLGYTPEGPDFEDPIQQVRGRFLVCGGPRVELLEPLPGSVVLDPWLDRGVKVYHTAYVVEDLPSTLEKLKAARARVVVAPVPAVAFGGRHIAFVVFPSLAMVELISAV